MKLHLSEATSADIDAATQFYGPEKGDFVAPALLHFWPLPSPNDVEVARSRVDWSCQQQKDILENDPTTRFVKVVDLHKDSELVALGRWHRCPNGYVPVGDLEAAGLKDRNDPETWPAGLLKDLYLGLIDGLMSARDAWIGKQHCWILTTVKTREPYQRNGAGSMILEWGLQKAAEEGVPACLEAVPDAKGLYEAHGFREVGTENIDGAKFGVPEFQLMVSLMKAVPK